MSVTSEPMYQRILLKLSGEALMGDEAFGIDPKVLQRMASEIGELIEMQVQVGLVIGGGNLFRGAALQQAGLGRVTGDHMGMLATLMNALAMRDELDRKGLSAVVMSALPIDGVVEAFDHLKAKAMLKQGVVVIFAAGTGNPFFTTDSAACLRGIEVEADLVLKATKVDGVYSADPNKDPSAEKFDSLTYDQVLERQLGVMDLPAICLCKDHNMPLRVFNMNKPGVLKSLMFGQSEGTLITNEVK